VLVQCPDVQLGPLGQLYGMAHERSHAREGRLRVNSSIPRYILRSNFSAHVLRFQDLLSTRVRISVYGLYVSIYYSEGAPVIKELF
jgi:hypothetical protein